MRSVAGWKRPYARAVGRRIRGYREALGLSVAELARRVGVPGFRIWRWESGRNVPSPERIRRLTAALGVELADLMPGAGPLPPPVRWRGQEAAVGVRLAALRRERGLTILGLAALAGMAHTSVGELERGRRGAPRYETLARLATALEVLPDALLPGLAPPAPAWLPSPADDGDGEGGDVELLGEAVSADAGDVDEDGDELLTLLPDPGPAADVPTWVRYGRRTR